MSRGNQLSVSALIRRGNQLENAEDQPRSKDEYRKLKNLEEQRKAGEAPAMVDVETGRDINPHIPEFIEKTPWYHQRPHPEREKKLATLTEWYPKGATKRKATKYREGACENCGAMGHSKKDCFDRPRAIGAKFTNEVTATDDNVLPELEMGYDAKRDRWNGYDSLDYKQVHEEYEKMEETRKLVRAQNIKDGIETEDSVANPDEDKYAEDMAPGQSVDMDSRTRITVRNLRIREDTAKYLYNLDPNAAHYDPKSVEVHALAGPTKLETLAKEYKRQKTEFSGGVKQTLLDKYGGQEFLNSVPKELLLAQTENYVEYNRTGKIIKGHERPTAKSRYDEDIYINNHTSVYGSYWEDGQWGYKCCHQTFRNSYCIGQQGKHLRH